MQREPTDRSVASTAELTRLLHAWSGGDASALENLTPLVYAELRRIAHRYMTKERDGHLLQTSALVNEAYVDLAAYNQIDWRDRNHFFAVSALLMRRILTDFARSQQTVKRGNRAVHLDLASIWNLPSESRVGFDELDQALERLSALDERQAKVVEMRFFGGLENAEIASVLGVAEVTVRRDWRMARAWLYNELTSSHVS
jgi:RNA polymerase sigma factor (TIGR02999 family)